MFVFLGRIINQVLHGHFKPVVISTKGPGAVSFDSPFRLWPIDMDIFMHMNNASYVRVSELARWRAFPAAGFLKPSFRNVVFLVTEQKVKYLKPILPFRNYTVRTTVTSSENKWLHYEHRFISVPKEGKEPTVHAVVEATAVVKRPDGRTFKIDEMGKESDFFGRLNAPASEK